MNRRLYRSRNERMIAGVCGGLAEYFNLDPTLVRLLWVVTALPGGIGAFLYFVAWLIVPEEPALRAEWRPAGAGDDEDPAEEAPRRTEADEERERAARGERRNLAGLILVGLGVLFLLDNLFPWYRMHRFFWPVVLIVIGLWIALRGGGRNQ
ncbi:MAG: PspC domain-containing protein [Chitinophagales bacterium]